MGQSKVFGWIGSARSAKGSSQCRHVMAPNELTPNEWTSMDKELEKIE